MTPTLRDLVEAPERAASIPPDAMAGLLGELLLLLVRLLAQTSVASTDEHAGKLEHLDRLLTVREAATLLNLRHPRVYELIRQRTLPAVRVGKYLRVRPHDLDAWIEDQREKAVDGKIQPGLRFSPPMSRSRSKARGQKSR
jgi:excisionase family DNA binding protein